MRCDAVTRTLQPGEQAILEIAVENPAAAFHVRSAHALELGSTFEIQQVLFDGECQMSDEPIEACLVGRLSLDCYARPRSIVFLVRNSGTRPGCLAVGVSDGLDTDDEPLDELVVH